MIVPHDQLRPDTLEAVIEEFVTRDGAVHGHTQIPVHEQIDAVKRQLQSGKAVIVFDAEAETCTIVLRDELGVHDATERKIIEKEV